jgi:alpha-L-fucosidase
MGRWMEAYGQTIYGTTAGVVKPQAWGAATRKGSAHYIHILNRETEQLTLQFPAPVRSAKWLNPSAASKLAWKQNKKTGSVTFNLTDLPQGFDAIIEVK